MTPHEHLLCCLAEECAEVAQRASKALRFGLKDVEPGQELNNAQRLNKELIDLTAVIEMLEGHQLVPKSYPRAAIDAKRDRVVRFIEYAAAHGHVSRDEGAGS